MRRMFIMAAVGLLVGASSAPAVAGVRGDVRHSAKVAYAAAVRVAGKGAVGRNIAVDGVRATRYGVARRATVGELRAWRSRLWRIAHPPVVQDVVSAPAALVQDVVSRGASKWSQSSSQSSGAVPACASESGTNYSTGPENTNPSGATGRYQIIPSTHAAVCGDLDWSPAGQDACAGRIMAAQGSGAWVGCGG